VPTKNLKNPKKTQKTAKKPSRGFLKTPQEGKIEKALTKDF